MQPALRKKLKFPAANADFFSSSSFFPSFLYNLYNVLYYFVHYIIYISGYIYRRPHCHVFTYLQKLYETSPSAHYYTLILFDNFTTSSPKEIKIKGIILYCMSLIILNDKYSFDGMTLIRVSDS